MARGSRILLVEDDLTIQAAVEFLLRAAGHKVELATTGAEALRAATATPFDLIILDVGIPPPNGIEVCRMLRAAGRTVPILFLTARASDVDQVDALGAGGDQYVIKPFSNASLLSVIRAMLRREQEYRVERAVTELLACGPVVLDVARREVTVSGEPVSLTPSESLLLETLLRAQGGVVTRDQLTELLWKTGGEELRTRAVDMHIYRLRHKLGKEGGKTIRSVRGVGYRISC